MVEEHARQEAENEYPFRQQGHRMIDEGREAEGAAEEGEKGKQAFFHGRFSDGNGLSGGRVDKQGLPPDQATGAPLCGGFSAGARL